ncbi:MA3 [Nesidiocoris tenuis]|uniref:MA3 n=2 Tax=Nesidiocoris tenuis TaxID=355587 RepID=A0ABN7AL25_9HEMI|nr:MA3 [Nesidiocoris tenuis]
MSKKRKEKPTGPTLSRKESRKQQRQMKKQAKQDNFRKHLSFKKLRTGSTKSTKLEPKKSLILSEQPPNSLKKTQKPQTQMLAKSVSDTFKDELKADRRRQNIVEKEMRKQRNKQFKRDNKLEDKAIKQLEKQLRLNKRKSQSIPKTFVESGLDYILDVCDSSKVQAAVQAEMNLQESGSEFEEDLAVITGSNKQRKKKPTKKLKDDTTSPGKTSKRTASEFTASDSDHPDEESDDEESLMDDSSDSAPEETSSKKFKRSSRIEKESSYDEMLDNDSEMLGSDDEMPGDDDIMDSEDDLLDNDGDDGSTDDFGEASDDDSGPDATSGNVAPSGSKKKEPTPKALAGEERKQLREDIYGRLRDEHGNIIQANTGKYVPPHLRNQKIDDKKKAELEKLTKSLKGLLNRLAENNMHSISNTIDELYMKHSRHDMNSTLFNLFVDSLVSVVHTPERLVMEHAMLIAILHANVGSEVGAFFLQHLGEKFDKMHSAAQEIENKELDNLVLFLCHMYTFKMFDAVLLYDILKRFTQKFTPKDIDLILVVLRTVGFSLRKDNPLALKDFIHSVQKLANQADNLKDGSRVRFMLDILLSIKNNNVSKIPQYDTSHSEHLKKIIKPMFRKGNYVTELKITLEELLKADERGKWWVVGSAWTGPAPQVSKDSPAQKPVTGNFTDDILELARKHHMNTATRKNIFCILMTAEDYLDAFEKLLKLGLKGQPEQDIVHVLIHCLMSEKNYNPYYSHVADQLCLSDRRHRMTIQYSVWDRFKELKTHSSYQITNLAKFLAHLFIQNSLPLTTLKVLEFTEMDKPCVRLLRQILLALLLHEDQEAMVNVFARVSKPSNLLMFRESVRLFMHHFLLKNIKDLDAPETVKLTDAVALAEQALMAHSASA